MLLFVILVNEMSPIQHCASSGVSVFVLSTLLCSIVSYCALFTFAAARMLLIKTQFTDHQFTVFTDVTNVNHADGIS